MSATTASESLTVHCWELAVQARDIAVQKLAECLWRSRGANRPENEHLRQLEADRNWCEAEWLLEHLRPSFVLDTTVDAAACCRLLEAAERDRQLGAAVTARLIVAFDGAPEFRAAKYQARGNDRCAAAYSVEAKDAVMYRVAYHQLRSADAVLLDQPGCDAQSEPRVKPDATRGFQDVCVAAFTGENGIQNATSAALAIHRRLAEINAAAEFAWPDQLHARISLGRDWENVVAGLPHVWRGETLMEPSVWEELLPAVQALLLASGVRIGPAAEGSAFLSIERRDCVTV